MSARDELIRRATALLARDGLGNTSLRALATELGTSHRMLIYHFGSRDGLVIAVVDDLARTQQALLDRFAEQEHKNLLDAGWRFWTAMVEASVVGPLLFELSGPAMRGAAWKGSFQEGSRKWTTHIRDLLISAGTDENRAEILARMTVAVTRGTLWELAITGCREVADTTMRTFLEQNWPHG